MSRHPTYQFRLDRPAPWTRTNQVYYKKMKSGIRLMHDAVVLLLKDWQDYERVIWAFVCYQYFLGKSDEIQYLRTEFHGLEYLRSIVEHLRELREMMEEADCSSFIFHFCVLPTVLALGMSTGTLNPSGLGVRVAEGTGGGSFFLTLHKTRTLNEGRRVLTGPLMPEYLSILAFLF